MSIFHCLKTCPSARRSLAVCYFGRRTRARWGATRASTYEKMKNLFQLCPYISLKCCFSHRAEAKNFFALLFFNVLARSLYERSSALFNKHTLTDFRDFSVSDVRSLYVSSLSSDEEFNFNFHPGKFPHFSLIYKFLFIKHTFLILKASHARTA